jgi:hypothetical protein
MDRGSVMQWLKLDLVPKRCVRREYGTMDKVQNLINPECNVPSSEFFRIG